MKTQPKLFVLFLFLSTFISARSWAQINSIQPKHELEASQDAHWLGEEIQTSQPVITQAEKGSNRSIDAMHWTAVDISQRNQFVPALNNQPIVSPKLAPLGIRTDKQVKESAISTDKPTDRRL